MFLFIKKEFQYRHEFKKQGLTGVAVFQKWAVFISFPIGVFFQHYGSALTALEYDFDLYLSLFIRAPTNQFICFLVFYPDLEKFYGTQSSSQSSALSGHTRAQPRAALEQQGTLEGAFGPRSLNF